MKSTISLSRERFRHALSWLLGKRGRGGKTELALFARVSKSFLSEIIKGRKGIPDEMAESAADYFGYRHEEMLALGRWIMEGKNPAEWRPSFECGPLDHSSANIHRSQVDEGLLESILDAIEESLTKENRRLQPAKKAQLAVTLYDMFRESGGSEVDKTLITRLAKLAA